MTSGQYIKGSNKILGQVYFIPAAKKAGSKFMVDFLANGRRHLKFANTFTGGVLVQHDGKTIREPASRFRWITRYEAIKFSGDARTREIKDREYPGLSRKKGQGVVNARGVNFVYKAGTWQCPA